MKISENTVIPLSLVGGIVLVALYVYGGLSAANLELKDHETRISSIEQDRAERIKEFAKIQQDAAVAMTRMEDDIKYLVNTTKRDHR